MYDECLTLDDRQFLAKMYDANCIERVRAIAAEPFGRCRCRQRALKRALIRSPMRAPIRVPEDQKER